jgi:hypothetical protein
MLCSILLGALLGGAGQAAELGEAEARAVRAVVQSQLDAMAADDAERAFSYATPGIRSQFGNAQRFMAMVRQGYPMVIRPASVAYFRPEAVEAGVVQVVGLRDAAGQAWLVAYQLERQPDASWRVSGCVVQPDPGPSTI